MVEGWALLESSVFVCGGFSLSASVDFMALKTGERRGFSIWVWQSVEGEDEDDKYEKELCEKVAEKAMRGWTWWWKVSQ